MIQSCKKKTAKSVTKKGERSLKHKSKKQSGSSQGSQHFMRKKFHEKAPKFHEKYFPFNEVAG